MEYAPGFSQFPMNRLKPIPPRISLVDFSLKKTSRRVVEVHTPLERSAPRGNSSRSSSPKKRQRTGIDSEVHNPFDVDDAFVYLDDPLKAGKVFEFCSFGDNFTVYCRPHMIIFVNGYPGELNNCNRFLIWNQFLTIQDVFYAMQIQPCIGVGTAMECRLLV